jgi:hypothetical protein
MIDAMDKAKTALMVAVQAHTGGATFTRYIEAELAGDFAVVLADMLAAREVEPRPVARVGNGGAFFLRRQDDGSPWPYGTNLYAEPVGGAVLTENQRKALEYVIARLEIASVHECGHAEALRALLANAEPVGGAVEPLRVAVDEMARMLESGEWAEHVSTFKAPGDATAARLESAITDALNPEQAPHQFTGEQIAALRVAGETLIERYAAPLRAILANAEQSPAADGGTLAGAQLVEIARRCAAGSCHAYAKVPDFMPHRWVIEAMAQAVGAARGRQRGGYCERAGGCVCGGDLPRVREGCSEWVKE